MIDFHCHLDLYPDPRSVVRRCAERSLYVLSVTNTPSAWHGTAALAAGIPRIRTALGLHPQLAAERVGELPLFKQLLPTIRYVGEVGLDGTPAHRASWAVQARVFGEILYACAAEGGRVLSVHSRGAAGAVLDMLESHRTAGTSVLHWFSGTRSELQRASDMGCWFSIGPAMLAGAKGKDLVSRMPRDRIVTESDGPFANISGRALGPWDVESAVNELGNLWNVSVLEAHQQVQDNLGVLVRDPRSPWFA